MTVSALALLSSVFMGITTILIKIGIQRTNVSTAVLMVTLVGTALFLIISIFTVPLDHLKSAAVPYFLLAGVLSPALVRWLYFISVDRIGASMSASISATGPVFTAAIAMVFLEEHLTVSISLGIVFIIGGIVIFERDLNSESQHQSRKVRDFMFPLLASMFFAFSVVIRKMGLNILSSPVLGVAVGFTTSFVIYAIMCLMSPKLRKSIILKRNDALYLCGAGIFLTGGWLVLFYALSIGDAVVVTPLSSLHPLVVLGLSYFFLKDVEKITKKIVLGAVLSVFGVVLITLR